MKLEAVSVNSKTQRAATLIEMMFVIAIVAAVAMAAVNALHTQARDVKVHAASEQLTRVLQAGKLYFQHQNNQWPTSITDLIHQGYLPKGFDTNVFGGHVQIENSSAKDNIFIVSSALPKRVGTDAHSLAEQIQGLQAYATVLPKQKQSGSVRVVSTLGGGRTQEHHSTLYGIYSLKVSSIFMDVPDYMVPKNCPVGTKANLTAALTRFTQVKSRNKVLRKDYYLPIQRVSIMVTPFLPNRWKITVITEAQRPPLLGGIWKAKNSPLGSVVIISSCRAV